MAAGSGSSCLRARPHLGLVVVAVALLGLSGCGSSSQAQASATPGKLDDCLVGKWKATEVVALHLVGKDYAVVRGKGGGLLTIASDGTWTRDYSSEAAMSGAIQGQPLSEQRRGVLVERIRGSGGNLSVIKIVSSTETSVTTFQGATTNPGPVGGATINSVPYTCSATALAVFGDTYARVSH